MDINNYKLSPEEKQVFLQKEIDILNDAERLNEYQNFVSSQKTGFLQLMNYINMLLAQHKKLRQFIFFCRIPRKN